MFRSLLVAAAQRPPAPPGPPRAPPPPPPPPPPPAPGGPEALEAQFSCPICLEVLRGVPAALPPGAVPALPALPHAVRPQEGGEGLQRGEAALVLQGPLQRLQQKGDPSQNAVSRLVLCEGAGADGQLPQVRPRCPHVPAYPQQYSQSLHVRVPVLRGPEPGPAGAGEALHGEPPQRPQQSGVPGVLGHALGGPQLQERQLPPAPPPQAQVFLRHLRGLQHRRGGSTAGCSGSVSLRELRAAAELLFASDPLSRPFCTLDLPAGEARSSWPPRDPPPLFPLLSGLIPPP
ncbi:E3 ubiquitin-protein ligase RNF166 isoform X1 [Anser cygnoides]|uniref:E3 ubiquitin-protein ligase RNF166 isoform X1 n=1 Tax=Anser cygnoides TaxID=8845 RepID=UPI0034D3298B